jgi:hypothetical protein
LPAPAITHQTAKPRIKPSPHVLLAQLLLLLLPLHCTAIIAAALPVGWRKRPHVPLLERVVHAVAQEVVAIGTNFQAC